MNQPPTYTEAANVIRARLEQKVEDAQRALRMASWELQQFNNLIRKDAADGSADATRTYKSGLTKIALKAVNTFEGAEFTPLQLHTRILEMYPTEGPALFPNPQAVTRTINKWLSTSSTRVVRVSEGAGLKAPVFKQALQPPAGGKAATAARLLPD